MGDETAIREMSNQIGMLNGTLTEFAKNQKDTNALLLGLMQKHETKDEETHKSLEEDVTSLKTSRKLQRVVLATSVIGTPAAAAKLGMFGKIIAAFAGTP